MFTDRFETEAMFVRAAGIPTGSVNLRPKTRTPKDVQAERGAKAKKGSKAEGTTTLAKMEREQRARTLSGGRDSSKVRSSRDAKKLTGQIRRDVSTNGGILKAQTSGLDRGNTKALLG